MPAPRKITATDTERERLLEAATPRMRLFLLLCADLGIRHRTAARIAPSNYDRATASLQFTTKGNTHQTLPVTEAIRAMLDTIPQDAATTNTPFTTLLRGSKEEGAKPGANPRMQKAWDTLKRRLGIRAELHIHDLRRTAAEDVWEATKDLRTVQAQLGHRSPVTTARYLANKLALQQLTPVIQKVEAMRAARRNATQPQRKDTAP